MAVLGKMDQMVAFKGVSMTIAPLGAVCCVLFSAPDSPAAKVHVVDTHLKYKLLGNICTCDATGVLGRSLLALGDHDNAQMLKGCCV